MRLLSEYRSTIKGPYVEELMDLVLYRPISFVLVKLVYPFPITPNQISFLAMAIGFGAGLCFALGNPESFLIGGLLFGLVNVLDCSDGMLARLKRNGTITGRIVDGVLDYFVSISLYAGMAFGLTHAREIGMIELPFNPWLMCSIAGASNILSSGITDHFRNRYLTHVCEKPVIPLQELQNFRRELQRLKGQKGHAFEKFMIRSYIRYTQFQLGRESKPFIRYDAEQYKRYNRWLLLLWNFIGPTSHFTVLVVSAVLYSPMIFFVYAILFCNTWILVLYPIQWAVNRRLTPLPDESDSDFFLMNDPAADDRP